jgi:hypothetical protein
VEDRCGQLQALLAEWQDEGLRFRFECGSASGISVEFGVHGSHWLAKGSYGVVELVSPCECLLPEEIVDIHQVSTQSNEVHSVSQWHLKIRSIRDLMVVRRESLLVSEMHSPILMFLSGTVEPNRLGA